MSLQALFRTLPRPLRRHKAIQTLVRMRPNLAIQKMTFNDGARLLVDLRDANARMYFFRGVFEPEFFAIAAPFVGDGATVFDVGANFGFCTFGLMAAPRLRRLKCHLFEANGELCTLLRRSAAMNPAHDVMVNHGCVTNQRGISRLTVTPHDWGSSFITNHGTHSVPNIRLDDYCGQHGITAVDFTKIDIEGHEPAALRGAEDVLRRGVLKVIYLEVSGTALQRQGFPPGESCELLKRSGYRLFYCKPDDLAGRRANVRTFDVNGRSVALAECTDFAFPAEIQTDLLAIYGQSSVLA